MFHDDIDQFKEDLKDAVYRRYSSPGSHSSFLDESILDNEEEKQNLIDDPDIYDLLDVYVGELKSIKNFPKDKDYEEIMMEELDDVLREMTMEVEGIVG